VLVRAAAGGGFDELGNGFRLGPQHNMTRSIAAPMALSSVDTIAQYYSSP